jgi:hypothetical protein
MVVDGTQGTSGGPGLVQWLIDWDYDEGVSVPIPAVIRTMLLEDITRVALTSVT